MAGDDEQAVVLHDPARMATGNLAISPGAMVILQLMDGTNDLRDIQGSILRDYGQMIEIGIIRNLAEVLDENLFLEGGTFDDVFRLEMENPGRPALLAGQAYPADAGELAGALEEYYVHPSGPGRIDMSPADGAPAGLTAPHIDFNRGGPCYAWAYGHLAPEDPPDLIVILGTAHMPIQDAVAVSAKDFETPLGLVRCEAALAREVTKRLELSAADDELSFRMEHSVELQAVWLAGRYGEAQRPRVLPVLVGSFLPLIEDGLTPEESPRFVEAAGVLGERIAGWGKENGRVTILASVDLSHVGPQFEDDFTVTDAVLEDVRAGDLDLLEHVAAGDYEGFFRKVAANGDRTHICGLASIYMQLRLLGGRPGRLLAYDQWVDDRRLGLVSFAGLIFP